MAATRAATDADLRAGLRRLAGEMLAQGTTTFECKSGYGLTVEDEARSVALAAETTDEVTYLGAHVVPAEFEGDAAAYVDLVCGPMLDACAPHARWVDVFCERGAFSVDEARAVLTAGQARGLIPRIHASQLGPGQGVLLAVELGAASADHCTFLTDADVDALAASAPSRSAAGTVATLLPGAEFGTRQPYPDARRLLDAGATVALATDCNPGSSYTSSMPFCIALAVRDMHMTTAEAVWAATAGGARALRRADVGYLAPGAKADLVMLDAPSHTYLAYRPGVPLVRAVWQSGLRQPVGLLELDPVAERVAGVEPADARDLAVGRGCTRTRLRSGSRRDRQGRRPAARGAPCGRARTTPPPPGAGRRGRNRTSSRPGRPAPAAWAARSSPAAPRKRRARRPRARPASLAERDRTR